MRIKLEVLGVLGVLLVLGGCGGKDADGNDAASGTTGSTAGTTTTTTGAATTATATTDGTATTASTTDGTGGATTVSTATSTTGLPDSIDCSGTFAEPVVLFEGSPEAIPQSFSITPDELQLYYVMDTLTDRYVERRVRSSRAEAFGAAEPVLQFSEACAAVSSDLHIGTLDLSPDGLGMFISCELDVTLPTTLIHATRSLPSDPFVADTTPLGTVGASFATADGLEAFANTPDLFDQVEHYQRDTLEASFSAPDRLSFDLRSPDPSNDGLFLFGSALIDPAGTDYQLAVASRASIAEAFGEPSTVGFPVPPAGYTDSTVTVSADCKTLYFLRYSPVDLVFSVVSSSRQ